MIQHQVKKLGEQYGKPLTSRMLFVEKLVRLVPIVRWLPQYNVNENLLGDVFGGLTVGVMHVPQG